MRVKVSFFKLEVTILCPENCFFFFSFFLLAMRNLSSLTKDQTCTPCIGGVES